MPILSVSEFEAKLGNIVLQIEKELVARGSAPKLETARDELKKILSNAKKSDRLKEARPRLDALTDVVTGEMPAADLLDDLWDIADFIDYRA